MISLYGGRLTLEYDLRVHQWVAQITLSPKPEHQRTLPTGHRDAQQALRYAMLHFEPMRVELSAKGVAMCWDCQHWEPGGRGKCNLNIPEARKTGGRFAAGCALFMSCPTQPS